MNIMPTNPYRVPFVARITKLTTLAIPLKELEDENVSVEELHDPFEEVEFGNSVGDLLRVNDKHG